MGTRYANTMKDCLFCKIAAGEVRSHKIWEDRAHLAFLSIFPNTEGVSVVIPKAHYPSYAFALPDDALSALMLATKNVATLLDNPRSSAIVLLIMLAGVPVYFVWRRLFSHPLP